MGTFSIWHWLIVLIIVVLVFGTKKLKSLGGDLGAGLKSFKDAMREGEASGTAASGTTSAEPARVENQAAKEQAANTIDVETKTKV